MSNLKWWQRAVFYQIYPRSFADGNGDGIGDFIGMVEKLDYLADLGINAIWLSPHFPSPNWDCGYDVSDYRDVAPEYGTLDDFRVFLREAHARDIRVILDLVLNHTSDEHPWFIESKSSRDNPKADWYMWTDKPNNWQSCFGGEGWTYCPERDQYYYHYFMKQQPDLNWRNPEVKEAMWDIVRFWLDMGVDGFRLDAIGTIYEDPAMTPHTIPMTLAELNRAADLADTPQEKKRVADVWYEMFHHQWGQAGLHDLMKELRRVIDEYEDRLLIGEDDDPTFMGNGCDELHLVFNFPLMRIDAPLTPTWIRKNQKKRLAALKKISPKVWPCNTLGNHDTSRVHTRYADGVHDAERARLSIALMLTLRGTPFLYNGEEIGMTDLPITDPAQLRDTVATWYYNSQVKELGVEHAEAAQRAAIMTRDKNRTPMQWANQPNAGFSPADVQTWLPVNPNYADGINVKDQQNDSNSIFNFYRRLLDIRKSTPALIEGGYKALHEKAKEYFAFIRTMNLTGQDVLVVLNYSAEPQLISFPELSGNTLQTIFSSAKRGLGEENPTELHLHAFEVYIGGLL